MSEHEQIAGKTIARSEVTGEGDGNVLTLYFTDGSRLIVTAKALHSDEEWVDLSYEAGK